MTYFKIFLFFLCHQLLYLEGKRWTGKGYNDKGVEEYELKDGNGFCKDYNFFTGKLKYEGEYLNGERILNGKGKEYNDDGELIFEGEFLNGKKWNGEGGYSEGSDLYIYESFYQRYKDGIRIECEFKY